MKVQWLMQSPILNPVEHELMRSELVYHCPSCIICVYLIACITILLSKNDDLKL